MQELTTAASLVGYETFERGDTITAVLSRAELEKALRAEQPAGFWLSCPGIAVPTPHAQSSSPMPTSGRFSGAPRETT